MKTTQATVYRSLQYQIGKMENRLLDLRMSAATGKRINKPSDDPSAIRPMLNARSQIQQSDRYLRSIGTASDRLSTQDSYLDELTNLLTRAQEITIAAGNGAMSAADLTSYGDEMGLIKEEMFDLANANIDGKYIFSGFAEDTKPFADSTVPATYNGDDGQIELEIAPGEKVRTNLTARELFQDGAMFTLLDDIQNALDNGDSETALSRLGDLKTASEDVSRLRSKMGNIAQRVDNAQLHMEDIQIDMQEVLSRYQDVDIIETIASLNQQELAFEAALNVTAKVSDMTILDYL